MRPQLQELAALTRRVAPRQEGFDGNIRCLGRQQAAIWEAAGFHTQLLQVRKQDNYMWVRCPPDPVHTMQVSTSGLRW